MNESYEEYDDEELISKSQLKREAAELTQLGKDLVALDAASLDKIPLDSQLRDAVDAARTIKSHGALKRQQQFIGKLLRNRDNTEVITAYEKIRQQSSSTNAVFKQSEKWRELLLEDEKSNLQDFINRWPAVDRQKLRQLIRNARKEMAQNKPPKSSRELFRLIRETIEE